MLRCGSTVAGIAISTSPYRRADQNHCKKQDQGHIHRRGANSMSLVCFELLVYFIGGAGSGFLAKSLGYGNFYIVLAIASVVSLILSQLIISKSQKTLRSEML